jgi:hypothetical protein
MDQTIGYACPRHPGVRRLAPGLCPKCGVGLVERATPADTLHAMAKRLIVLIAVVIIALAVAGTAAALLD